ncbi:MAG: TIM barrel protein [Defluviitaleaceae bacterium]|nr:TIM barrel protein [Defluviitaleaceae bacterium]
MNLCVCLNAVTSNLPRTEAMRQVGQWGYTAVEFWEGTGFDVNEYKAALDEAGLTVACMGVSSGLVDPSTRQTFLDNLKICIANAQTLGAKCLIAATGQELPDVPRQAQHDSIVAGLTEAAQVLEGTGLTLCLEPLNILVNHKGYYLSTSAEAFEIVRKVNNPQVKVLFDIYHQQITEGNLITNITENLDLIGHFHIAGNPGRGEPYFGEINYPEIFKAIAEKGYAGYAGLEYWPKIDTAKESLTKMLKL